MKYLRYLLWILAISLSLYSCKKFLSVDPPYAQDAENYFKTPALKKEKKDKVRQRLWKVRAKKVILATGSIERPLILFSFLSVSIFCIFYSFFLLNKKQ